MQRLTFRLAVVLLTFLIGIAASASWNSYRLLRTEKQRIAAAQLEDNNHKLYEASGMTGDRAIQSEVTRRFRCMGADCALDGIPREKNGQMFCEKPDGTPYMFSNAFDEFQKKHLSWSLQNMAFLKEANTREKAAAYVKKHQ